MTFNDLINEIESFQNIEQLELYLTSNIRQIQNLFYQLDFQMLQGETGDQVEGIYHQIVKLSGFHSWVKDSPIGKLFLINIATTLERSINRIGVIVPIINYLPKSSIKYRLKVFVTQKRFNNRRRDYIDKLEKVLGLLSEAEFFEVQEHTTEIVNDLVAYYQNALLYYNRKNYQSELEELKQKLLSTTIRNKFDFVNHRLFQRQLGLIKTLDVSLIQASEKIYEPTQYMFNVFERFVVQPIKSHQKTEWHRLILGYTNSDIRRDILQYGRADFDKDFNSIISSAEKVLLYCYLNMRKHFFTSYHVFDHIQNLKKHVTNKNHKATFIDLGCGPATSLLAFTQFLGNEVDKIPLNYIGIDISQSMINKAKEFNTIDCYHPATNFKYHTSWNNIELDDPHMTSTDIFIINASYLFSSSSLSEQDLANFINRLNEKFSNTTTFFIFQNPDNIERNTKYENFKLQLKYMELVGTDTNQVFYNTFPNSRYEPSSEVVYYEILERI